MQESMIDSRGLALDLLVACSAEAADAQTRTLFVEFARNHADCCERTCVPGHLTGSAWLVSADGERALLLNRNENNGESSTRRNRLHRC